MDDRMVEREAARTIRRLLPGLERSFATERQADPGGWASFVDRLNEHGPRLFACLLPLYGTRYDFHYHVEQLLSLAGRSWLSRPAPLRALDESREADPGWFHSQIVVGAVGYVDLFGGDLAGVRARLPYLRELGVTYLHLMPLFRAPAGNSDGGYAVSSYREVNPALGTMEQLAELATELRGEGISLVLDFVFNHTSDEHIWALQAVANPDAEDADGDLASETYLLFPDHTTPDAFERSLREIFPEQRRGSFTYRIEIDRWVWTTFNSFQWDLNYANPTVFRRMAAEMLFLANQGVEVLRLDAVAFIWKRLGTSCENLPEAHLIIRAYNALARIAAPALLFKSEAIVHPDEVARYIDAGECQLSYNPLLMALLWESLATRDVRLLRASLQERFQIPDGSAWVNYIRSHDDIGWTFDDGVAARLGINGFDHRRFLNAFYTGRFPGSFARGVPFQENPRTGDARIAGTAASLAGLEKALREEGPVEVELAIRRMLLLYGVALSIGGIPLLYLGDELATLNDYGYTGDPANASDSRWIHRPALDWACAEQRHDPSTIEGRMFGGLHHLTAIRKSTTAFAGHDTEILDVGNDRVFAFARKRDDERVLVLANVTEREQLVAANQLRLAGLAYTFTDLLSGDVVPVTSDLLLAPYQLAWLQASGDWA